MASQFVNPLDFLTDDARASTQRGYFSHKPLEDDDVLWQHMKIDYFYSLLSSKSLYFRSISSYEEDDVERSPIIGFESLLSRHSETAVYIEKSFLVLSNYVYISCWFHNSFLINGIFDRFTKYKNDKGGIAIKTRLSKLLQAVSNTYLDTFSYYGNMQYIPETALCMKPSCIEQIGKVIQVPPIAPFFYKGTNLADEMEMRLLLLKKPNPDKSAPTRDLKIPVSLLDTIEGIALPTRQLPRDAETIKEKLSDMNIDLMRVDSEMDGYEEFLFALKGEL